MPRVSFRVPHDILEEFATEFRGQNQSVIIALLMRAAVADARRIRRKTILRTLTEPCASRPARHGAVNYRQ